MLLNLPTKDWMTGGNAQALANKIEQYWHSRGHTQVRVRVLQHKAPIAVKHKDGSVGECDFTLYCVRSTLVSGLPPLAQPVLAKAA